MAGTNEKILETISNMTVMEVVDLISEMEEKFGVKACPNALGTPTIILVAIIRDIPLPIPLSEICSPNHIKKTVPVTIDKIAVIAPNMLPESISPAVCRVKVRAVD